ncbi:MAG: ABC transporter permease [Emcibacter sp.]|nr:ABC transporter permease [Emcibacter sp.]
MWLEIILDAWRNLVSRKMRFFQVSFGVAIGSAAFIILLNIGLSVIEKSMQQFAAVGVDIVTFSPERTPEARKQRLDRAALINATRLSGNIEDLTFITMGSMNIKKGNFRQSVSVVAAEQSLYSILNLTSDNGRLLTALDKTTAHAVIGSDLAVHIAQSNGGRHLIPGDEVIIGNTGFVIVGILKSQPENLILPFQVSNMILIRPEAMGRFLKSSEPSIAAARLSSVDLFSKTQKIIKNSYSQFTEKNKVGIVSAEQLIETMTAQSKLFATFLIVIGLIVFGVAGIGVMNSLMTSLNERIHEIGVRLAIGAQPEHIVFLFLTEALIICLSGGLAGLIIGVLALYFISFYQDIPVTMDGTIILFGIGAIILSGIIFGLYPALKAAWIKPISALRMD